MQRTSRKRIKRQGRGDALTNNPKTAVMHIPKSIGWSGAFGQFMPPVFVTKLRFEKHVSFSQATIASTSVRYIPTFVYDVDPNIGSTAVPGFTELGQLYRNYRVLNYTAVCQFANQEAFAVTAYLHTVAFSDPSANVPVATAQSYLSNRQAKRVTLSAALGGKPTGTQRIHVNIADFAGSIWSGNSDNFCGSTSGGAPNNNCYLQVGAVPTNGTSTFTTSTGVAHSIAIDMEVAFFVLANPTA